MDCQNGIRMCKDANRPGPSGMSRNKAFSLFESWGGVNYLLQMTDDQLEIVCKLKLAMGGDSVLECTTLELSMRADNAYNSLGILQLLYENIWAVLILMLPLVFPQGRSYQV
jgi:hypothetical protein